MLGLWHVPKPVVKTRDCCGKITHLLATIQESLNKLLFPLFHDHPSIPAVNEAQVSSCLAARGRHAASFSLYRYATTGTTLRRPH